MKHFNRMNTVGIRKREAFEVALASEDSRDFKESLHGYSVGLSSGTSGHRGIFLTSKSEAAQWAGTVLAKCLPSRPLCRHKIALFLRANNNLYEATGYLIRFEYFDIYADPEENYARLFNLQPTILVAPPSVLRQIAEFMQRSGSQLRPLRVVAVAEVLEDLDEAILTEAFGQPIHQIYQATEGFLGFTCHRGTIHLNEDSMMIEREYLDPEKTRFHPIVTDLRRYTQPIVRYRLNDVLVKKTASCTCGSKLMAIDRIEGRADDIIYLLEENGSYKPLFADFFRRALIKVQGEICEYRLHQVDSQRLEISVLPEPSCEMKEQIIEQFESLFGQMKVKPANIDFVPYRRPEGKLRRVTSNFRRKGIG